MLNDLKLNNVLFLDIETVPIKYGFGDIDGSQVSRMYWEEKDLERIKTYCQQDVLTVAQLLLTYKGKDLIKEDNIEFV